MIGSKLISTDNLTTFIKSLGIDNWKSLKFHTQNIPYGRNSNRSDLSLVIKENRGTCSSKHALLKHLAGLNQIPDIKLYLCIYKMNQSNTPGIGDVIETSKLDYIPEAHCFISDAGENLDLTTPNSDFKRIENDIIEELEIEPHEVNEFKVNYHKDFMMQWIVQERIPYSFEQVWALRERCIQELSVS